MIKEHGLRLVHHVKCIYDSNYEFERNRLLPKDLHLQEFLGADGLMRLLAILYECRFSEPTEVLEMIKRLYIPGYEQARRFLDEAVVRGVFSPNTADGFPHQYQIELVLDWAKEEGLLE